MSLMAIDYGGRRIGVAVSDSGVVATPHSVVRNDGDVVETLARLARELDADTIVVGLPRRAHAGASERKFRDLADRLRQTTCKEVVLWDETLSTAEAAAQLRDRGVGRGWFFWRALTDPFKGYPGPKKDVEVRKGQHTATVLRHLEEQGILRDHYIPLIYIKIARHRDSIKAGVY